MGTLLGRGQGGAEVVEWSVDLHVIGVRIVNGQDVGGDTGKVRRASLFL